MVKTMKDKYRKFSDDELKFMKKNKERHEETIRRAEIKIQGLDHLLNHELHVNYLETRDNLKRKKREIESVMKESKIAIDSVSEQIKTGKVKTKNIVRQAK